MNQTDRNIEAALRAKAQTRIPRLEYCLNKLEKKIANVPTEAWSKLQRVNYEEKKPDWENLCQQYRDELATIRSGSYHGYNGKPFGVVAGATFRI